MANYLDIEGLSYFKEKMDGSNDSKYVKSSSIDNIIDNKLTAVYTYKGSVDSVNELPTEDNKVGDVYDVGDGMNYAWNGSKWDSLGDSMMTVDAVLNIESTNPIENKAVAEAFANIKPITDTAIDSLFE